MRSDQNLVMWQTRAEVRNVPNLGRTFTASRTCFRHQSGLTILQSRILGSVRSTIGARSAFGAFSTPLKSRSFSTSHRFLQNNFNSSPKVYFSQEINRPKLWRARLAFKVLIGLALGYYYGLPLFLGFVPLLYDLNYMIFVWLQGNTNLADISDFSFAGILTNKESESAFLHAGKPNLFVVVRNEETSLTTSMVVLRPLTWFRRYLSREGHGELRLRIRLGRRSSTLRWSTGLEIRREI